MSKIKTLEEKVTEYMKCKEDFEYYCPRYVYIELAGGDKLLKLYEPQAKLASVIRNKHHVIVLKSRQIGISTLVQAYVSWLLVFYKNVITGIISKDGPEATTFARNISSMIDKLPDWMKPKGGSKGFVKRNEQSFILANGSKCFAATVNPKAPDKTLRGKPITFLVIDELAFIDYAEEAWTSLVPSLSTSQKQARDNGIPYGTVLLSTPNKTIGTGAFFYKMYTEAKKAQNIITPYTIHWKDVKELASDPSWYRTQCQLFNNDYKKIQQELELKFLPTKGSFIPSETAEKLQNNCQIPIQVTKIFKGESWKWEEPTKNKYYITGVDTASEFGEDNSAIVIFDYETMNQVWEYCGKCSVDNFSKLVIAITSEYPGLVVIESNSYGNQVIETFSRSDHLEMLYRETRNNKVYSGLSTNARTRPLMISSLYTYVTQFPETIKSERLALELVGLTTKSNDRVEADRGVHDDLAMAAAFCYYVREYDPPLEFQVAQKGNIDTFSKVMTMNNDVTPNVLINNKILNRVNYIDINDPKIRRDLFNRDKGDFWSNLYS